MVWTQDEKSYFKYCNYIVIYNVVHTANMVHIYIHTLYINAYAHIQCIQYIQHSDGELAYIMVNLVQQYSLWFCCTKGKGTCNISPSKDGQSFFIQLSLEITRLLLCSSIVQVTLQCLLQKNTLHILMRRCLDLNS